MQEISDKYKILLIVLQKFINKLVEFYNIVLFTDKSKFEIFRRKKKQKI